MITITPNCAYAYVDIDDSSGSTKKVRVHSFMIPFAVVTKEHSQQPLKAGQSLVLEGPTEGQLEIFDDTEKYTRLYTDKQMEQAIDSALISMTWGFVSMIKADPELGKIKKSFTKKTKLAAQASPCPLELRNALAAMTTALSRGEDPQPVEVHALNEEHDHDGLVSKLISDEFGNMSLDEMMALARKVFGMKGG